MAPELQSTLSLSVSYFLFLSHNDRKKSAPRNERTQEAYSICTNNRYLIRQRGKFERKFQEMAYFAQGMSISGI
jgi:hypothetical protein